MNQGFYPQDSRVFGKPDNCPACGAFIALSDGVCKRCVTAPDLREPLLTRADAVEEATRHYYNRDLEALKRLIHQLQGKAQPATF
jgi:predicted amidophosphoribosyltransferase